MEKKRNGEVRVSLWRKSFQINHLFFLVILGAKVDLFYAVVADVESFGVKMVKSDKIHGFDDVEGFLQNKKSRG